jgi:hypothetical protein
MGAKPGINKRTKAIKKKSSGLVPVWVVARDLNQLSVVPKFFGNRPKRRASHPPSCVLLPPCSHRCRRRLIRSNKHHRQASLPITHQPPISYHRTKRRDGAGHETQPPPLLGVDSIITAACTVIMRGTRKPVQVSCWSYQISASLNGRGEGVGGLSDLATIRVQERQSSQISHG